jgi:nucleoid-associated protein YgaU
MKKILFLLIVFCAAGTFAFAQEIPPASKPDAELTEEQAEWRINDFQKTVNDLQNKLDQIEQKIAQKEGKLEELKKQLEECREQIKKALGVNDMDIEAFRQKLGVIEGKVRSLKRLPDDQLVERQDEVEALEAELNELRGNKLALIPEFYNKIIYLAKEIRGLYREKKITTYTVGTWAQDRDCLWNISGKIEIYGDPFQWPKIWQANQEKINNPDIIFPGQVLQIPEKGPMDASVKKAARRYYRQKQQEMQEAEEEPATGAKGE